MTKGKPLFLLLLSLLLGALSILFANKWLNQHNRSLVATEINTVTVIASNTALPAGTKLNRDHVKMLDIPAEMLTESMYEDLDQVVGLINKNPILTDEILRKERLTPQGAGSTLASIITPNKRAVTIRVNDVIGVAGFLQPGNLVDVLSTVKVGRNQAKTETVLQQVKVLAVDQSAEQDQSKPTIVRAVTLEATAEEAEILMTATGNGEIHLALRNPFDVVEQPPQIEPSAPPKLATRIVKKIVYRRPRSNSITVIRGVETSKVKVSN